MGHQDHLSSQVREAPWGHTQNIAKEAIADILNISPSFPHIRVFHT